MFRFRLRCPIAIHYLVQSYIHILNKIFPNNLLPWLFNRTIPSVSLCLVPPSLSACLPGLCISEEMSCQRLDWSVECEVWTVDTTSRGGSWKSRTYILTVRLSLHSDLTLTRVTREPVLLCDSVRGEERRGEEIIVISRHGTLPLWLSELSWEWELLPEIRSGHRHHCSVVVRGPVNIYWIFKLGYIYRSLIPIIFFVFFLWALVDFQLGRVGSHGVH